MFKLGKNFLENGKNEVVNEQNIEEDDIRVVETAEVDTSGAVNPWTKNRMKGFKRNNPENPNLSLKNNQPNYQSEKSQNEQSISPPTRASGGIEKDLCCRVGCPF